MRKKLRESISLGLTALVYMALSVRYYPGNILKTLTKSGIQILSVAPITVGGTIIIVSLLQHSLGAKLPRDRILRIFLTLGIIVEFLYGLYNYAGVKGL
jgi:hypothetical protein